MNGFVDFIDLPPDLQQEVRDAKPLPSMRDGRTSPEENELALHDRMFWVRKDGHMSRAKGHWLLTKKAGEEITRQIKAINDIPFGPLDPPGKGSLREWKSVATFSLDRPPK